MAEEIDDLNNASNELKAAFSALGGLVSELNQSLKETSSSTEGIADNISQSNDFSSEFLKSTKGLSQEKKQQLSDDLTALRTGKGLTKEKIKEMKLGNQLGNLAGTAAAAKAKSLGLGGKVLKKQKQSLQLENAKAKAIKLGAAAMDGFFTALMAADKETTAMARGLNMSKSEAIGVKKQFAQISLDSGDIAINSIRLGKANAGLNAQLGTGVVFSGEMLTTFSKLTEIVGISAEAAGSLAFQGQLAGQSFREVEENVLGASYEMQRGVGIQLNMKDVLEATGKVTGQVRANLGATPELIAKAVTAAKLLGAELGDIVNAGKSMLNFESSIEAELEAELLTGKQLNLERARGAALAGDQVALAEELGKNIGSHGDYMKMNVLQQDALAKAMGMSSDSMADMLFKQETMNMNAQQLRAQGKDELADKLEQLDTQEKIALATEKFHALMGDVMIAVLPIVEGFGNLVGWISQSKVAMGGLIVVASALAAVSIVSSIAGLWASFAKIPFGIGIPLAIGATIGLLGMIATAKSQVVSDGIAPPGGGPFKITDKFGATAITAAGDGVAVSPNISKGGGNSQPVVIQNNWDAFAASNGNGRKGLGGTQSLQASPTFA